MTQDLKEAFWYPLDKASTGLVSRPRRLSHRLGIHGAPSQAAGPSHRLALPTVPQGQAWSGVGHPGLSQEKKGSFHLSMPTDASLVSPIKSACQSQGV
jgi:hypothetical protein